MLPFVAITHARKVLGYVAEVVRRRSFRYREGVGVTADFSTMALMSAFNCRKISMTHAGFNHMTGICVFICLHLSMFISVMVCKQEENYNSSNLPLSSVDEALP